MYIAIRNGQCIAIEVCQGLLEVIVIHIGIVNHGTQCFKLKNATTQLFNIRVIRYQINCTILASISFSTLSSTA